MIPCTSCGFVLEPGQMLCPSCGIERPGRFSKVSYVDGELIEYGSQDDGEPIYTSAEKRNWYQALMWYGTRHNFNKPKGWAYYAFKEKFSEKPSWDWRDLPPVEPTELQVRWIKHYLIKSRKRYENQKREAKPCPACGSTRIVVTPGSGPHAAGKRCDDCGKHLGWIPKGRINEEARTDGW
jgi:predicted RNA-binding Zn-ribbon protein involved in translation (DUF1610 family)